MKQKINLNKQVFSKTQYPRVINTEFTQLTPTEIEPVATQDVSVSEFFILYDKLFFEIPKTGNNSHETLITTSTDYVGYNLLTTEIEALQQEISELRRQLLEERNSALNTIADVLDEAGLNLPELPEIPNIEVPSEFSINTSGLDADSLSESLTPEEEQTRRERRKERRAQRKEDRQKRREGRREERRENREERREKIKSFIDERRNK